MSNRSKKPIVVIVFSLLLSITPIALSTPQSSLITGVKSNGSYDIVKTYVLHEQELELIQLIAQHPLQQRSTIYLDPTLTIYANVKTDDMANRLYFEHTDPDDGQYITYYFGDALGSLSIATENLAAGYASAATVVAAWENSTSGHRESMLGLPFNGVANPLYSYFGVGFVKDSSSTGPYAGLYWSTENAANPGAFQGNYSVEQALAATAGYQLLMPDGKTPVDRNWNWVTADIAGIAPVHVENDGTYTSSWFGHFKNLGGMFVASDNMGFAYNSPDRTTGGTSLFVSNQGWLWTTPETAPFYWSRNRGNWIYIDRSRKLAYDYNNHIWEDWTPDGSYARIMSDKRQSYVGQPVVIAWDADVHASDIVQFWSSQVDANGNPAYYSTARKGAILWHPPAPGSYIFAVRSKNGTQVEANHLTIDVIPHPQPGAQAQISASKTEVNINEVYTINWSTTGGVPIVRATPGVSTDSVDGVFSNNATGSVQFRQQAPGIYTYTLQHGAMTQQVAVKVNGSLATPLQP